MEGSAQSLQILQMWVLWLKVKLSWWHQIKNGAVRLMALVRWSHSFVQTTAGLKIRFYSISFSVGGIAAFVYLANATKALCESETMGTIFHRLSAAPMDFLSRAETFPWELIDWNSSQQTQEDPWTAEATLVPKHITIDFCTALLSSCYIKRAITTKVNKAFSTENRRNASHIHKMNIFKCAERPPVCQYRKWIAEVKPSI